MAHMRKKLMKNVDLDEPTSFLDDVNLRVALNVNANRTKQLQTSTEKCSNHEFLQEELQIFQCGRNLTQKLSRGPTTWKDMLNLNQLEDYHKFVHKLS